MLVRDTIFVKEKRNSCAKDYRYQTVVIPIDSLNVINFSDNRNIKTFKKYIESIRIKLPKNIFVMSKKQILAHKLKDEIRQDYDFNREIKISFFYPSNFTICVNTSDKKFTIYGGDLIKSIALDKDAPIQVIK